MPFWNEISGPIGAWSAIGYLGNYLVNVPDLKLVAVRQRRDPRDERELTNAEYGFGQFPSLARRLVASRKQ